MVWVENEDVGARETMSVLIISLQCRADMEEHDPEHCD